jgi:predicted anti-sigma-YlaC factor YlaD
MTGLRWQAMSSLRRGMLLSASALIIMALTGCAPRQLIIGGIADELATQTQGAENDVELAREASAFYLKFSESILRQNPGHQGLAAAVSAGYTQYAYAFVAFDAEQLEARDAKAAERLRLRAAKLYQRAQQHALRALEEQKPGFAAALASQQAKDWPALRKEQAGLAYWAAAAWGGWISLSKDEPDVVADLPLAIRLAELAWATDPNWGDGALTGLLGSFEAGRTGGNLARAQGYFDQSIQQSNGRLASPLVGKAEGYALPAGDRELFETLLAKAISIQDDAGSPLSLQNEIMRQRARWLLQKTNELF